MVKLNTVVVEEKRAVRFATWDTKEVGMLVHYVHPDVGPSSSSHIWQEGEA